ncbi:aromatic-ring-hydroxylating dioxygenase subunit beta [Streptomyces sp. DSM 41524]|uniref:Aromatic-ring-hydroxylating dioxygenase subunit beta n=1 Tax=Streptomyces asiaticus subsp. ignotus TaxID=3098222 RepID=A0ABU7QC75_9ACTN|nr:aromatic-ring-hydroxylating dioxygenase subunit beta [Streptomyces sp. DSM 41524]
MTATDTTLELAVQRFLYDEAALLDAQDFAGWLALFTEDTLYWIPAARNDIDPTREVSLVRDDIGFLTERVWRFDSGLAYAQEPRSRTARTIGNVRVLENPPGHPDDEVLAESVFHVAEFRRGARMLYAGRCRYRLRRSKDGFLIREKKVELVDVDGHFGNLSLPL